MTSSQRLLACFSAVFPARSRQELALASRDRMQEWDSLASVTLLALINEEFGACLDVFDFQELGSFASLLEYLEETIAVPGGSTTRG